MRCACVCACVLMPESGPQPRAHPLSLEGLLLKHTYTAINTHCEARTHTHTHLHPNIRWDSADFSRIVFVDMKKNTKRQKPNAVDGS